MVNHKNETGEFININTDINSNIETQLDDEDDDEKIETNDEVINQPFDPTKIRVDTRPMTIDLMLNRIKHGELELSPDFQRKEVWTDAAKSKLIESILIRIPLPAFYIDATDEDKWIVIDGLQRLTALKQFILEPDSNDTQLRTNKLKLTKLDYLTDLEYKTYDELPRKYQRRILETQLLLYVIEEGTPTEVKYSIFRRINTGGVPLSPQELRNALNQGKATKLLAKLTEIDEFKKVTKLDKSKRQQRMIDQEFILGFLAYTLNNYSDFPKSKSRDEFFHKTMEKINKNLSENQIKEIELNFKRAMVAAYDIFGEGAFRKKPKSNSKHNPINQALFEVWSVSLSQLSNFDLEKLKERKEILINQFINLVENDSEFFRSISQAAEKVTVRFSKVEQLIQEVLA